MGGNLVRISPTKVSWGCYKEGIKGRLSESVLNYKAGAWNRIPASDGVGDVEAQCAERKDCIECRGRADLDEGEGEHARCDEEESAEGDFIGWVDAGEEVGEGEAVIACECPGEAGYGGETVKEGDPAGEHAHRHQHVGCCFGARGLVGDCDDGVARGAQHGLGVVAHAVQDCDEVGEGKGSVDHGAEDHGPGHDHFGVFDFFGHVDYSVEACLHRLDPCLPDKGVRVSRSENNEYCNGDGQEDNVHDSCSDLNSSQNATREDIDQNWDNRNGPHEQRTAPSDKFIVRMRQHNQALDLGSDKVRGDADESRPREDGDPTCFHQQLTQRKQRIMQPEAHPGRN
ncbi:unnamed protein product [Aspergillus oryzae]|nr:unnamed protein product [Aspergillus oryzae]